MSLIPVSNLPIKIVSIEWAGGVCPYQLQGITDDKQYFYLRYRSGRLRAGVAPTEREFWESKSMYNVIDKQVGDRYDGWVNDEYFAPLVKGIISFPEGFKLDSKNFVENDKM
jgi:hypothetical protein